VKRELEREAWYQAVVGSEEELSDGQWEALKTKVLMGLVKTPGPNASAALAAMKEMDRQRERRKGGSQAALEETRRRCLERMAELDALEAWAEAQGVSGTIKAGSEHPVENHGSEGPA